MTSSESVSKTEEGNGKRRFRSSQSYGHSAWNLLRRFDITHPLMISNLSECLQNYDRRRYMPDWHSPPSSELALVGGASVHSCPIDSLLTGPRCSFCGHCFLSASDQDIHLQKCSMEIFMDGLIRKIIIEVDGELPEYAERRQSGLLESLGLFRRQNGQTSHPNKRRRINEVGSASNNSSPTWHAVTDPNPLALELLAQVESRAELVTPRRTRKKRGVGLAHSNHGSARWSFTSHRSGDVVNQLEQHVTMVGHKLEAGVGGDAVGHWIKSAKEILAHSEQQSDYCTHN